MKEQTQGNIFDRANFYIRNTESSLVNLLSAIAPWGAPLAPAYMSYGGMVNHLGFTHTVALILAGVIEILGLATVHTTITFWQFNRRRLAEYKKRPTELAAGMFGMYLTIILVVNVLLEWPNEWAYMPLMARALLSLLSVPAAVTLAIRAQHTELLSEGTGKRAETSGKLPENTENTESSENSRQDWRSLPVEDKALIKSMNTGEIASRYGVSDRTARNWRTAAQNGNGRAHD